MQDPAMADFQKHSQTGMAAKANRRVAVEKVMRSEEAAVAPVDIPPPRKLPQVAVTTFNHKIQKG